MTTDERAAACANEFSRVESTGDIWLCRIESIIARHIRESVAELQAEIDRLRETIREYCDDDEVSSGFGSGCYTKHKIKEIRKRHGIGVESEGG